MFYEPFKLPVRPFLRLVLPCFKQRYSLFANLPYQSLAIVKYIAILEAVTKTALRRTVVFRISQSHIGSRYVVSAVSLLKGQHPPATHTSEILISIHLRVPKPDIHRKYLVKLCLKRRGTSPFARPCSLAPSLGLVFVFLFLPEHT